MDSGNREKLLPNPRAKANIFEILTFSWTLNLFKKGKKRDLEYKDVYTPLDEHKSSLLGNELEKRWKIELDNATKEHRDPSLLKVIIRMFGFNFLLYGLILAFVEIVLRMSQPKVIGKILTYFGPDESSNKIDLKHAYINASYLVLSILGNILLFHFSQFGMLQCGMKIRTACCSAVYRKALRLSKTSLGETTVGQVVNLLSNDVNRFDAAMPFIQFLWIGPLSAIVVTYFVWLEIGVSSLFGVATFIGIIPIQGWLGKKMSKFRSKTASKTDERVRLTNEIISGMQVIKMFTWEKPFAYLVQLARKMEIKQIKGALYINVVLQSFKVFHSKFALFVTVLAYVLLGNNIDTQKVYTIITYHGILLTSMTVFFPQAIGMLAEVLISIKRIQSFLLYKEKHSPMLLKPEDKLANDVQMSILNINICALDNFDHVQDMELKYSGIDEHEDAIAITNASVKWNSNQPDNCLNKINLTVKPGKLVAVIGPVGAGKSLLIQTILKELPLTDGNMSVQGIVSYASQESWLFNSSIRQNILFNSPMNIKRYNEVIQVCALKTDLALFPHGDRMIVGEKGVSLSGGQKARINLARAIYKQADIYLLDDPLSAVDTHVGKHLFEKCIKGYLKEKTCILITHQIQYLTSVDQIVVMENSNILANGSYQELQSSGIDLTKYLGISEETKEVESYNEDKISNDLETFSVISRSSSIKSDISTIIEEKKLSEAYSEPVEVSESRSSGNISRRVYLSFISAGGRIYKILFLLFICIVTQVLLTGGDYWISVWVNLEDQFRNVSPESTKNSSSVNIELPSTILWWPLTRHLCVLVYSVLISLLVVSCFIRSSIFVSFFTSVSLNLHNNLFNAMTRATMHFFNTNSTGRILNRFTKDMGVIDEKLAAPLLDLFHMLFLLLGALVVVGYTNIYLMIPTSILVLCYYCAIHFYLSTSRSIKRLEGVSRSPILGHLSSSLQGIVTIRASQAEQILVREFDDHLNLHTSVWYLFLASSEAYGFMLDMISLIYLSILIFSFLVVNKDTYTGGNVGLIITQAMSLTGSLQWGIRQSAEFENQMTSIERVLEYTNIPKEAALESPPDKKPKKEWPDRGKIIFQQLCLRYSPDTNHILKNLNIRIQPMEKVGIVGRTGAGKSSLITALFRLAINEGNIIIDDVEIHELGLRDLRSKLSIIPQEPVLFSGSMRKNLDPFDEYPDHVLWNALDEVELKITIEGLPDGLNSTISEGGSNFSVGQRQLVCLARAIVRSSKILMLDEATANIDSQTDALIQTTIRNKFRLCTVLTIAHRLNTVMDSDKVLVMDAGTMVEFDHPYDLLKNKNGYLYKMVEQTGPATADLLHNLAAESYKTINNRTEVPIVDKVDQEDLQKNE